MIQSTDVSNYPDNYSLGVTQNQKLAPSIKVGNR